MWTADFRMPVIGNDGSNSLQVMDATELGPPENRRVEPRAIVHMGIASASSALGFPIAVC